MINYVLSPLSNLFLLQIHFEKLTAAQLHNFIRGMDKVPGAWTNLDDQVVKLYGSKLWTKAAPEGTEVKVEGMSKPGLVHNEGLLLFGNDGGMVNVTKLTFEDGKMIAASRYGQVDENSDIELTEDELTLKDTIKVSHFQY